MTVDFDANEKTIDSPALPAKDGDAHVSQLQGALDGSQGGTKV